MAREPKPDYVEFGTVQFDKDGTRLLFMEDVAEAAGITVESVRHYKAAAARHRRERNPKPGDMPKQSSMIRRRTPKKGGHVIAETPVWRDEAPIREWIATRMAVKARTRAEAG